MQELNNIIQELKAPKARKNTFGGYNYRSCEDILEAVKPLLAKHNCTLVLSDEVVCVGNANYIKATAQLKCGNTSVSVCGWAREELNKKGMDAPQMTGTASSYARKYALNGLFCIDDTKDADTNEYHTESRSRQKEEKTAPQPQPAQPTAQPRKVISANTLANPEQCNKMLALLESEMRKADASVRDFSPVLTLKDLGFEIEPGIGEKVANLWFSYTLTIQ